MLIAGKLIKAVDERFVSFQNINDMEWQEWRIDRVSGELNFDELI